MGLRSDIEGFLDLSIGSGRILPPHWYLPRGIHLLWFAILLILVLPILLYNVDGGVRDFMDANSRWFESCPCLIGFWVIMLFIIATPYWKEFWGKDDSEKKAR